MSVRFLTTAIAMALTAAAATPALAQQATADEVAGRKDHLTALPAQLVTPPKTADGVPDFQGTWGPAGRLGGIMHSMEEGFDPTTALFHGWNVKDNTTNVLIDPMRGKIPYQPWTNEKRMEKLVGHFMPIKRTDQEPWLRCLPAGIPRASMSGSTIKQMPGYVVFLGTARNTRIIPTDGRPHIDPALKLWNGDSIGRWEGNVLVIETTNHNDKTEFDQHGTFHTDNLRVVERLTMIDNNTIFYEATIEDPKVFTQPWKIAVTWDRNARPAKPWEDACYGEANDRNIDKMVAAGRRSKAAGITGYHIHDPNDITKSYAASPPLTAEEQALAPPSDLKGAPPKYEPGVAPPMQAPKPYEY